MERRAILGLGRAEAGAIVLATPLLANVQHASIQVEIAPAKPQQFPKAHAGLDGRSVEGVVRLIGHSSHEGPEPNGFVVIVRPASAMSSPDHPAWRATGPRRRRTVSK